MITEMGEVLCCLTLQNHILRQFNHGHAKNYNIIESCANDLHCLNKKFV